MIIEKLCVDIHAPWTDSNSSANIPCASSTHTSRFFDALVKVSLCLGLATLHPRPVVSLEIPTASLALVGMAVNEALECKPLCEAQSFSSGISK